MELLNHPVFKNITEEEYNEMMSYNCIRFAEYKKGEFLLKTGEKTKEFGVLIYGKVFIESVDLWGNRMILHQISRGGVFAESYAFCSAPMTVDVVATEDCKVLLIDLSALLLPKNQNKPWYMKIMQNMLSISSNKNLIWSNRMFCITSKSIRTRVMSYLSSEAIKTGKKEFNIPFDRQEMADYLNVERSALSKELGKMKKEGILTFNKNHFCLSE